MERAYYSGGKRRIVEDIEGVVAVLPEEPAIGDRRAEPLVGLQLVPTRVSHSKRWRRAARYALDRTVRQLEGQS